MPQFPTKITCQICGKRCGSERTHKDVCSAKCKRKLLGIEVINLHDPKNCYHCDFEFLPNRPNQIYCSHDCAIAFNKKKKAELKSEFSIFHRDNFTCIYCGKSSIEDGVKLEVEHIDPFSGDGLTDINNLITSCDGCNGSKHKIILPPQIVKRVLLVLNKRNSALSEQQLVAIRLEIEALKKMDVCRIRRMNKIS